jgi:hypothetical protein
VSRSKHAAWDSPVPSQWRYAKFMPRSKRVGRTVLFNGKPVNIPPTVPARKKDGSPDLEARFTRTLERHFAEKREAAMTLAKAVA